MTVCRFRSICKKCRRVYSLESSNTDHCSECQSNMNVQKNCCPNMVCKNCNEKYYSPNHLVNCPFCSAKGYARLHKKPLIHDNALITQKKKRKMLPLDELIRRSEYKRVFDDSGWDHYLKGRKWDRI